MTSSIINVGYPFFCLVKLEKFKMSFLMGLDLIFFQKKSVSCFRRISLRARLTRRSGSVLLSLGVYKSNWLPSSAVISEFLVIDNLCRNIYKLPEIAHRTRLLPFFLIRLYLLKSREELRLKILYYLSTLKLLVLVVSGCCICRWMLSPLFCIKYVNNLLFLSL